MLKRIAVALYGDGSKPKRLSAVLFIASIGLLFASVFTLGTAIVLKNIGVFINSEFLGASLIAMFLFFAVLCFSSVVISCRPAISEEGK